MASQIIDARGMACPMPVINTKKVLDSLSEGSVTTVVDNEAARDNVLTLATGMGCEVEVQQKEKDFYILITKKDSYSQTGAQPPGNAVIFCSSSELGRGSTELGGLLMKSLMFTIVESKELPGSMLFVNSGVHLTCSNSPVLEHLKNLEQQGVEILSCGTCLDYYKLKENPGVGQVSNMYAIYEKMNKAGKVISL